MIVALIAVAAFCCYVLTIVKLVALCADRSRSLVLREYTIATAAIAVTFTLLLPPVIATIDRVSANLALLLNSLIGIVCLTAGQTILVASTGGPHVGERVASRSTGLSGPPPTVRRTIRRWWIACLLIVLVRAVLFVAAPARVHHTEMVDFAPNYARYPTLAAFDALRIIWFAIVFTNMWRGYRAYARQESSRPTRLGLALHARAGFLGLGYVTYQIAYVLAQWIGHPLPGVERQIGVLMLLSVVATLIAATVILYFGPTLQARLTYRALRPLWQAVAATRAGAVLDDRRFTHAERLIRRRQETIDGLARLRNHYDLDHWNEVHRQALRDGLPGQRAATIADAAIIADALVAERTGRQPAADPLRQVPSGPHEAEVSWQIAVGKALNHPIVRSTARSGSGTGEQHAAGQKAARP